MTLEYRIGDVFDEMRKIPDGSVDLIVTSPPFLALRSYLPADHPHKDREIGSEATPAAFIDTLLALSAEWGRVLAPHGSLCVELGDTFAGSGGAGGDYNPGGLREGQDKFDGSSRRASGLTAAEEEADTEGRKWRRHEGRTEWERQHPISFGAGRSRGAGTGWPLAKSLTGIPEAYMLALAYGINPLTGQASPAGRWRVRNQIVWARPNPSVGALGDKFRPATSYITVACRGTKRYFDLDAVRGEVVPENARTSQGMRYIEGSPKGARAIDRSNHTGAPPLDWHADHHPEDGDWLWNDGTFSEPRQPKRRDPATYTGNGYTKGNPAGNGKSIPMPGNPNGAPPLDFQDDMPLEDGDWLWKLSTQPYAGSHYATFPMALPKRLIKAMCPLRVCRACGQPSERVGRSYVDDPTHSGAPAAGRRDSSEPDSNDRGIHSRRMAVVVSDEFTDCGHDDCRPGIVLDPFAGSGTTLEAAQAVGRHAIGIDLDARNGWLARERVGMFMDVVEGVA